MQFITRLNGNAFQLTESTPPPTRRLTAKQVLESLDKGLDCQEIQPLEKTYIQWIKGGNSYRPSGRVVLKDQLTPHAYEINRDMGGIYFEAVRPKTDEAITFTDSPMHKVVQEIDKFWGRKEAYDKLGLMHNRGILMYGPPGSGKSLALQQVVEMMVKRGDLVAFAKSPSTITDGLRALRQIEPTRRIVVCFEEADELANYDERTLLQLMDGDSKIDGVLFLATTNYIERLSPRMLRPGRFDKKVYIGPPSQECREQYLKHKLRGMDISPTMLSEMTRKTAGFNFGELRELIAGVFAMGEDLNDVLSRLRVDTHGKNANGKLSESGSTSHARVPFPVFTHRAGRPDPDAPRYPRQQRTRANSCPHCNGHGVVPGTRQSDLSKTCKACGGLGVKKSHESMARDLIDQLLG